MRRLWWWLCVTSSIMSADGSAQTAKLDLTPLEFPARPFYATLLVTRSPKENISHLRHQAIRTRRQAISDASIQSKRPILKPTTA